MCIKCHHSYCRRLKLPQSFILVSLQQFEEETEIGGNRYSRTLEELNKFKEIAVAAAMAGPPVAAALAAVYPCSLNGEVD
ncbi:unnamed protein product [Prunus armeniaca]|uniref:Uncharacterized protein n=1 Tax=Prunus armeniaca TaxID=36596 RepID=A0A6J5VRF1_PRUAR|nr:unnamed protein product [Prunus armeniaca]CAB4320586.1 unnamed protein product [Prunus armeniaca]